MAQPIDGTVNENLTPEAAVKLAMERERRADEFYRECASIVKDPGVRKLFEFLSAEEKRHHDLLEREYERFLAREN